MARAANMARAEELATQMARSASVQAAKAREAAAAAAAAVEDKESAERLLRKQTAEALQAKLEIERKEREDVEARRQAQAQAVADTARSVVRCTCLPCFVQHTTWPSPLPLFAFRHHPTPTLAPCFRRVKSWAQYSGTHKVDKSKSSQSRQEQIMT